MHGILLENCLLQELHAARYRASYQKCSKIMYKMSLFNLNDQYEKFYYQFRQLYLLRRHHRPPPYWEVASCMSIGVSISPTICYHGQISWLCKYIFLESRAAYEYFFNYLLIINDIWKFLIACIFFHQNVHIFVV